MLNTQSLGVQKCQVKSSNPSLRATNNDLGVHVTSMQTKMHLQSTQVVVVGAAAVLVIVVVVAVPRTILSASVL